MANTVDIENRYASGAYTKRPLTIVRGAGAHLWDDTGREYIDCVGGHGSANVGHANPEVARAIAEQAARLTSCTEIFYNDQRAALLCNSGAEAIEGAIKFARYTTGRSEIVAMMRGFHGRTLGALSATWEPKYRAGFEPLLPGFTHIPFDNLERADAAISDKTAGVLVELVQGEGGVRPASREFVAGLERLCHERGALLIVDEVQTGFGRVGQMFASRVYDVEPDLVAVAKSIAGGLPMGATLMGPRVKELEALAHGSTFGGNPLVCAASVAAIDFIVRENLPARAAELGEYTLDRLRRLQLPAIREVRGMGLLIGIELKHKVTPILQALMARGVLALPAGLNVLRLLPPLVIEKSDLDTVVDQIEAVLRIAD